MSRKTITLEIDAEHEDLQTRFRKLLDDTRVPLRDRIRMAASFGVAFAGRSFDPGAEKKLV